MSGAVERIEAALGAMEAAAKAATPGPWEVDERGDRREVLGPREGRDHGGWKRDVVSDSCSPETAVHLSLHNPAAVLALVDGLRKVVALHRPIQMLTGPVCTSCGDADEHGVEWPCPSLDALAAALDPGVGDGREVRGE